MLLGGIGGDGSAVGVAALSVRESILDDTRKLAGVFLPILARVPGALHMYMHPSIVDLKHPELLIPTVEDPNPRMNLQIARWVRQVDLILDGENISELFSRVDAPLLLMIGNADGIVPEGTAMSAFRLSTSSDKDYVICGTEKIRMAHADMYISRHSADLVFQPMARWLKRGR